MPSLELHNISKAYGGNTIFKNITQTFPRGCLTAIVGLNGSGKTTLLDLLCGICRLDSGDIVVNGSSIQGLHLPDIFGLGMARLFQESRIFNNMTVRDNIMVAFPGTQYRSLSTAFFQRNQSKKDEKFKTEQADQLLETIGLHHRSDALGKNISYGEQRLLAIGRQLATDAPILLFDEPSSGVRIKLAESLFKIIKTAAIRERIILVVEHNLDLVTQYADLILVLSQKGIQEIPGSLIQDGNSLSKIIEKVS